MSSTFLNWRKFDRVEFRKWAKNEFSSRLLKSSCARFTVAILPWLDGRKLEAREKHPTLQTILQNSISKKRFCWSGQLGGSNRMHPQQFCRVITSLEEMLRVTVGMNHPNLYVSLIWTYVYATEHRCGRANFLAWKLQWIRGGFSLYSVQR